jgi:hypothetical protein
VFSIWVLTRFGLSYVCAHFTDREEARAAVAILRESGRYRFVRLLQPPANNQRTGKSCCVSPSPTS